MPAETARYWRHAAVPGVDLLRARFVTHRYNRHAHETFTLGLVEAGVEEFEYGGSLLRAGRGAVALLNPEVVHTGQAAGPDGWTYRVLYPAVDVVTGVAAEIGSPTRRASTIWPGWPG
jgi:AraC-like ligand binding domain